MSEYTISIGRFTFRLTERERGYVWKWVISVEEPGKLPAHLGDFQNLAACHSEILHFLVSQETIDTAP